MAATKLQILSYEKNNIIFNGTRRYCSGVDIVQFCNGKSFQFKTFISDISWLTSFGNKYFEYSWFKP